MSVSRGVFKQLSMEWSQYCVVMPVGWNRYQLTVVWSGTRCTPSAPSPSLEAEEVVLESGNSCSGDPGVSKLFVAGSVRLLNT